MSKAAVYFLGCVCASKRLLGVGGSAHPSTGDAVSFSKAVLPVPQPPAGDTVPYTLCPCQAGIIGPFRFTILVGW